MTTTKTTEMRAAGGAIWRRRHDGQVEVVLVHRTRHRDWSLPKGKAEPGESELETALREVEEETAVRGRPGPELPTVRYLDRDGRHKTVRYWAMEPVTVREHEADDEIDQLRWLTIAEAREQLTYPADLSVVNALEELLEDGAGV